MMEKQKNCLDCGGEMIRGKLTVFSSRGCALDWDSDKKYPQKSSNPFRKGKMVNKTIGIRLMANGFGAMDTQEDSWYCPACGRVFASFKAEKRDVSE